MAFSSSSVNDSVVSFLQMIDEFTDVNKGEKELMKLWNTFSMQNKYEPYMLMAIYRKFTSNAACLSH